MILCRHMTGKRAVISMGNSPNNASAKIRIVKTDASWIESKAVHQLETVSKLKGIDAVVGLPDLHPGKGLPIGAAFISENYIYPTLIGNDIGCAMSFWQTDVKTRKLKLDRWSKKLSNLEVPWEGDDDHSRENWCEKRDLKEGLHNIAIGTIGGGNHFAELQQVETVVDQDAFDGLGLDKAACTLLVHSGSRALGQSIFQGIIDSRSSEPYKDGEVGAAEYMADHDEALKWSKANRELIAYRFMRQIGGDCRPVSDAPHNMIMREKWYGKDVWVHRKGAASSRHSAIMIPGSRGTFSYLVAPVGEQDDTGWSLAHGAGRRWQRGFAKSRMSHKYRVRDLERTAFGGHVICEDRDMIYDEAPQAYKDIEQVIEDLKQAGLIKIIAIYRPLLTYKQRRSA